MALSWAFAYFAAAVAVHGLLANRPRRGNSVVRFVFVGSAAGLALTLHLSFCHGLAITTFAGLAVYAFACELYIFLFTLVGTSISVKLLLAMRDGPLSPERIETVCATEGMVERRLERLRTVGLLEADDRVSAKGLRLVRAFLALSEFFVPARSRIRQNSGGSPICAALDTAPKALL